MNDQKKFSKLPLIVVGIVVAIFLLLQVIPWQGIALIIFLGMLIFAFLGHLRLEVEKEWQQKANKAAPYYQPTQTQAQPQPPKKEPPPRANPPLDFSLTAEEYRILSERYEQGYRPQILSQQSQSAKPKEASPQEYEQPQAHYPEQLPPLQQ
jgi:hypothetical protein